MSGSEITRPYIFVLYFARVLSLLFFRLLFREELCLLQSDIIPLLFLIVNHLLLIHCVQICIQRQILFCLEIFSQISLWFVRTNSQRPSIIKGIIAIRRTMMFGGSHGYWSADRVWSMRVTRSIIRHLARYLHCRISRHMSQRLSLRLYLSEGILKKINVSKIFLE